MFAPTKKKLVAAAVVLVLCVAGAAYAYWTAGGSGTGTAATGTAPADLVVNQTSTVTDMHPGDAAQTLSGDFDNTGTGSAYVTTVTASIASVTQAVGAPAGTCDASDYTLANATMAVGTDVPVGAGVGAWTGATIQFNNKNSDQDACQGATVNLAYTIG